MTHIVGHYFPTPEVPLEPGTKLIVKSSFTTVGGERYDVGHILTLVRRTKDAPHGYISSLGNWEVKNQKGYESVWSSIDYMVAYKHLEIYCG